MRGPKTFPEPYLTAYTEIERTRWLRGFVLVSEAAIEARSAARPTGSL